MLKGVCHLHSETGTEGGYWAFQDSRFIQKNVPKGYCKKCGKYLNDQQWENLKVEKVLPLTQDVLDRKEPPECKEGEHEQKIGDAWSYEGLHYLEDGDFLTIYSPEDPDKVVWQGTISLKQHPLFTEHASGFWIHADQKGIERDVWAKYFFERYPAELTKNRKS